MSFEVLVDGTADGELVVLDEPISLWGGFDPASGLVVDASHPQHGVRLSGAIVAMPHGRGSSSSSAVLAEAMRLGTAPAAFLLTEPDGILAVGSLVGTMLYDVDCPIAVGELPSELNGPISFSEGRVTV